MSEEAHWFNPPTPPREAALWDDVFGTGETDEEYFLRRQKELSASIKTKSDKSHE